LGGDRKFSLHDGKIGAAITVRVTPRMAKDQIYDILDDGTIKIRLTAPPVAGKANKALIRYLGETLEIPASWIEIIAGQNSHDKLISILNLDSEEVQKRILKHLDQ
jgi:uncharacterized protein (TIGR00251 family)